MGRRRVTSREACQPCAPLRTGGRHMHRLHRPGSFWQTGHVSAVAHPIAFVSSLNGIGYPSARLVATGCSLVLAGAYPHQRRMLRHGTRVASLPVSFILSCGPPDEQKRVSIPGARATERSPCNDGMPEPRPVRQTWHLGTTRVPRQPPGNAEKGLLGSWRAAGLGEKTKKRSRGEGPARGGKKIKKKYVPTDFREPPLANQLSGSV